MIAFLCMNLVTSLEEIEFGKRIQFDGENKLFTHNFADVQNNVFLFIVEYENKKISYSMKCPPSSINVQSTGGKVREEIFTLSQPNECTLNITGKGNFIIYSFKDSVAIDLKDTYGNINLAAKEISLSNEPNYQLTFLVNNLESDMLAYFDYNKEKIKISDEYYNIENPFKICVNETCEENNIQEYNFIKNNNYQIIVKIQVITDKNGRKRYVFPGFSFPKKGSNDDDKNSGRSHQLNIKLILMSLILLIWL